MTAGRPNLDFGQGFYTYQDSDIGRAKSEELARRKVRMDRQAGIRSFPFVLVVAIQRSDWEKLNKLDLNKQPPAIWWNVVNGFRNLPKTPDGNFLGPFTLGYDVVFGAVAREDANMPNRWIRQNDVTGMLFPDQYKFESPKAVSMLKPVYVYLVPPPW